MASKHPRGSRLSIPHRLKDHLPYIAEALTCLRMAGTPVPWIQAGSDEQKVNPFFSDFTSDVRQTIDRLAELHSKSRSKIVATALTLRDQQPATGAKPHGYAPPKK